MEIIDALEYALLHTALGIVMGMRKTRNCQRTRRKSLLRYICPLCDTILRKDFFKEKLTIGVNTGLRT